MALVDGGTSQIKRRKRRRREAYISHLYAKTTALTLCFGRFSRVGVRREKTALTVAASIVGITAR